MFYGYYEPLADMLTLHSASVATERTTATKSHLSRKIQRVLHVQTEGRVRNRRVTFRVTGIYRRYFSLGQLPFLTHCHFQYSSIIHSEAFYNKVCSAKLLA